MTLSEFQDLVLEKGDRLQTWSESQQREARDLLSASSEAAAILAEAGRIREALLSQNEVKAPAGLRKRVFMAAFSSSPERQPVAPALRRGRRSLSKVATSI